MLAAFAVADALLLTDLPRRRISFGPWKAQLFALLGPRVFLALLIAVLGRWVGPVPALAILLAGQVTGTLLLWRGTYREPRRLGLSRLTVSSDRLPAGAAPVRVLHVTDLHVERLTDREACLLDIARETQPDLIVITGDFLNLSYVHDPAAQAQVRELLTQLRAPFGVYAVLGSPSVDDREEVPPLLADLPILLLEDEWLPLDLGGGRRLTLLGLDCSHNLDLDRWHLDQLVAAAPDGDFTLLLHHSPDQMPRAREHPIDLYLCGHTHGGQVRLPLIGPILTSSKLGRRYVMGPYEENGTRLYVSRGIGLEGLGAPRVRLLCPPELLLVTIEGSGPPAA
jgi:predicted MPP superfamily phosphohydrolase